MDPVPLDEKPKQRKPILSDPEPLKALTRENLTQLERELIPLLNEVRKLLGKKPVYVPRD